ncbi:MAG: lipopolysaccharide heptosyltransferase II [Deltaproteobacteria bacterium]|nr:lipopolysaccharide heptosyltransferase II [Deltaproteobacteria bacterium]
MTEPEGGRPTGTGRDPEADGAGEAGNLEARKAVEAKEAGNLKSPKAREAGVSGNAREPRGTGGSGKAPEPKESEISRKAPEARGTLKASGTPEDQKAEKAPESPEAEGAGQSAPGRGSARGGDIGNRSAGPVLYARGLNWLGDAVIGLPALLAARLGWQGELLLAARGAGAALYRLFPGAGEVLEDGRGLAARLRFAREIRRRSPSKALLWQNAFGAALTAWLARVPERVGFDRHARGFLLTRPVKPGPEELAAHEVFGHLKLVAEAGMDAPFSLPRLPAPKAARGAPARDRPAGFLLALAPGASYGSAKRWPAASFAAAARLILEGRRGTAVILGGPSELEAASETERALAGGPPCLNLAGRTGLPECARTLADADLALTNDSGLMHLACALGTPTVTPFGPTNPIATGPLGLKSAVLRSPVPCSPCLRRECPLKARICFDSATPRAAAEAAERLLESPARLQLDFRGPGSPAAFVGNLPEGPFEAPAGVRLVFALRGGDRDPRLEPPELARGTSGSPRAPVGPDLPLAPGCGEFPRAGGPPAQASFRGRTVWLVPEGQPRRFYRDLSQALGIDPARSVWLGTSMETIAPARAFGGRAGLWIERGDGLPEGILRGERLPDLCIPGFQRALDWAGALL